MRKLSNRPKKVAQKIFGSFGSKKWCQKIQLEGLPNCRYIAAREKDSWLIGPSHESFFKPQDLSE